MCNSYKTFNLIQQNLNNCIDLKTTRTLNNKILLKTEDFSHTQMENLLQITIKLKTKLFHFNIGLVLVDVKDQRLKNGKLQTVQNWYA